MSPVLAAFSFWYLPSGFLWAFLAALNFWVWRRSKSSGHLVMLLGGAWLAQYYVLAAFEICLIGSANYALSVVLGSLLFAIGFYVSVKPLVADDLARVRQWMRGKMGRPNTAASAPPAAPAPAAAPRPGATTFFSASSGGTPPPPPPPPSDDLKLR
jgi:hypothetical protein